MLKQSRRSRAESLLTTLRQADGFYSAPQTRCVPGRSIFWESFRWRCLKTFVAHNWCCVAQLPSWTQNPYLDEGWARRNQARAQNPAPMQLRVASLLTQLGLDTRNVCASNVVFARSVTAAGINFRDWADRCWPVHQQIMEFVSPALVVVFGGDVTNRPTEIEGKSRRGNLCGAWELDVPGVTTDGGLAIIGLPHLRRYEISEKVTSLLGSRGYATPSRNP